MAATKPPKTPDLEPDPVTAPDDPAAPRATTTTERPRRATRSPTHATPPVRPGGTAGPAQAATTAPTASTPAATATPAPIRADAMAAQSGASMPMAAAALGTLAMIAAQYGQGTPAAATGQPYAPPRLADGRPTGPIAWDGALNSRYAADSRITAGQDSAAQSVNAELGRILDGAVDNSVQGRAAIGAIIAEVNTALTALGSVENTAVGRQLVIGTLGTALQRAGSVLGQGQAAAALTADRVAGLADRYLQQSAPRKRATQRPAVAAGGTGGPPRTRPTGQQGQWIDEAMRVLRQHGYDTRQIDPAAIAAIIQHESGGNPNAINLWDSNAAKGIPSKGLMQTIDPTFAAYALPGHGDIWNPVDNIIAGVRYSIERYGSVSNVPGIVGLRDGSGYVGY
ncbi:transglycosylase SLT domain-containing protein [Nocardia asteroides]|uniref:lytic transglycosylase domain-containing protein n=1 Tax=Nocardia asteroides TaxID=1824 RepID=UPI001E460DDB|nr:transglycosylase SLT domain-containing protein [Nocardia asteroides]UGT63361.1 transglycosylase SLT domain-containing protein [Nocardia asteroides]